MTNSQRLAAVRRCLGRWLEQQPDGAEIEIRDAILIRGGYFVGRRFVLGKFHAVWFMEEDEVKVYDSSGALVERLNSTAINRDSQPARPAVEAFGSDDKADNTATIPMHRIRTEDVSDPKAASGEVRRAA